MTDAQREVVEKVRELLGEHFEGYILSVEASCDDDSDVTETYWGGGFNKCFGMAQRQADRMRLSDTGNAQRPDDDEGDEWKART